MDLAKEAIARFLEANRKLFESPSAPPFRWAQTLVSDLAQAKAEAADLRARLNAIETSTTWRMTAPVRSALEALKRAPPTAAAGPVSHPPPATTVEPPGYCSWIAQDEA